MSPRIPFQRQAQALRRREITRLVREAFAQAGDFLRSRHEAMLRKPKGAPRLRPVNPTPV